jgi:hypothetical protein
MLIDRLHLRMPEQQPPKITTSQLAAAQASAA